MDERLKRNLKTAGLTTISILTGLIYVFYQMLTIELTQLNPLTLVGSALVAIICSLTIKQVMGESGFTIGYGSDEWKREEDKYNDSCGTANEYMDLADNFYAQEEIDKRRQYRRVALQGVRLRYIDWFDENGYYKGEQEKFDKLTKQQQKVVRKCIKVKIYILNLFSEYEIGMESYERKEQTDKLQRRKSFGKNAIFAILISAFGVYFTFVFTNFDWGSFWASMIQVILWLGFGVMQMMNNYYFVVKDRVSILKRKKELIQKFINGCKEHKYDVNPYDIELIGTEPKQEEQVSA